MGKQHDQSVVFIAEREHIYNYGDEDEIIKEDVGGVFESAGEGIKWLKQYAKKLRKELAGHEIINEVWREDSEYDVWYYTFDGVECCYMISIVSIRCEEFEEMQEDICRASVKWRRGK